MTDLEDFQRLQELPPEKIARWVDRRLTGDDGLAYWWLAMVQAVETSVGRARDLPPAKRRENFELGVRIIMLAVSREEVLPSIGASWLLRLARMAQKINPPVKGLPHILTPDAAVAWALDRMPLTREAAIESAARRRLEQLSAGDDYYVQPPGIVEPDMQPSPEVVALQETERILRNLRGFGDAVVDEALRAELASWLETDDRL